MSKDDEVLCVIREDKSPLLYKFKRILGGNLGQKTIGENLKEDSFLIKEMPVKNQHYLS